MPTPPRPASPSTRLEKFQWEKGRLRLEAAGKPIDLSGADAAPALQAFQAFYEEALNAYGAGVEIAPEPAPRDPAADPSAHWFARIRSLFARVLSHVTGKPLPGPPAPKPLATPPPVAPVKPAPQGLSLQGAFADDKGVHVIWSHGGPGQKPRQTELLYRFDSPVAERLQACYGGLAELGHDVVDLSVWRPAPAPEAAAKMPAPAKTDPTLVMRLHPGAADNPTRALVSPLGDDKDLQVLAAPERLVAALHAAADPKRPAAERLTHLRCATGRGGALKVVAVGLGENPEDPRTPARWENISPWWENAKARAGAPTPTPSRPGPTPELF